MKSSFINSFAVVIPLLIGCNVYGQRTIRFSPWFDTMSPIKPVSFTPQHFEGKVCEPTGVSIDSLIKWHQWRMVQLMKGRKGMDTTWYFGPEAIRKWEEGHKKKN